MADGYLQLFSGPVAVFIPSCKIDGELFRAEERKVPGWCSVLKALSYGAWFFSRLIKYHAPGLFAYRGVVQLQMVVDYFPLFMVIAKIFLRSAFSFHFYHQNDPSKKPLDSLLDSKGPFDLLPMYEGELTDGFDRDTRLVTDQMTNPSMRGLTLIGGPHKGKGMQLINYALIKVECLSSPEQIRKKILNSSTAGIGSVSEDLNKELELDATTSPSQELLLNGLIMLRQQEASPYVWKQQPLEGIYPRFFERDYSFTSSDTGAVEPSCQANFERLQKFIREGEGEDLRGIRWRIVKSGKRQ